MEEGQRQDDAAHVNMGGVLILVVMEEGQRPIKRYDYWNLHGVLILVVMEEGQRHCHQCSSRLQRCVLILVVMEEGQRRSTTSCDRS